MKRAILFSLAMALGAAGGYFVQQAVSFSAVVGTSMNPVLNMGDLITNEEISPSEVEVGDIIIYRIPPLTQKYYKGPPVIAHRVVEISDGDFSEQYAEPMRAFYLTHARTESVEAEAWRSLSRLLNLIPIYGRVVLPINSQN